jgi:hypothetical protein
MAGITTLVEPAIAAASTFAVGVVAITSDLPIEPKEVGLLTIVVGIGAWIVKSIDKTTDAVKLLTASQAESNKATALLSREIEEARRDGEETRAVILANLHDMPSRVAVELKGRPA